MSSGLTQGATRAGRENVDGLLEQVGDVFGGGSLSPVLLIGAAIALFLAYKAVKLVVKVVALGVGAFLLASTAPWSGAPPVENAAADCAQEAVSQALTGWQLTITKRITVEELSSDAACAGEDGLASGTATVKLRSFYDLPFQTWTVDSGGARSTSIG